MYSINLKDMDDTGKGLLVLNLINRYTSRAREFFQGSYFEVGMRMQGAALINEIIDSHFKKEIMSLEVSEILSEEDIYVAVKNTNGFRPSLFVSQNAFETLSRHMIFKLRPVSVDCAESVAAELTSLFHKVEVTELESFSNFKTAILRIIDRLVQERLTPTKEFINQFFDIEAGFINSKHPDFVSAATTSINESIRKEDRRQSEALKQISKRERNEIDLIKQMLLNYFDVVKKNVCDYIPKIIFTLLVGKTIDICEREIISALYRPEEIDQLLKESAGATEQRTVLLSEINELKDCLKFLNAIGSP